MLYVSHSQTKSLLAKLGLSFICVRVIWCDVWGLGRRPGERGVVLHLVSMPFWAEVKSALAVMQQISVPIFLVETNSESNLENIYFGK